MTDEISVQTSSSPREVGETNNLRRNYNTAADGTCPQCAVPFRPCTGTRPQVQYHGTYLFMVIIVVLRTDGHDRRLPRVEVVVTRASRGSRCLFLKPPKDVFNLCRPCRGPLCALVAPVDCQLLQTNHNHSQQAGNESQAETSQGCCAGVWLMWVRIEGLIQSYHVSL